MPAPPAPSRRGPVVVAGLVLGILVVLSLAWLRASRPATAAREDGPGNEARNRTGTPGSGASHRQSSGEPDSSGLTPAQWRRARSHGEGPALEGVATTGEGSASKAASHPDPLVPWVKQLFSTEGLTSVAREELESWLEAGHTNAADLLAARQLGGGKEFLLRALQEFPSDPAVLLASISLDDDPASQRERLDRLKHAAPSNALANYLAAREAFKAGDPERAVAELMAASGKSQFEDYTRTSWSAAESLLRDLGRSDAEAAALGGSSVLLPHLAEMKAVATELADLQKAAAAAGDATRVQQLAELGWRLGQQLTEGPGSQHLIGELVGLTLQQITLRSLDDGATLPFLSQEVGTTRAEINDRRTALRQVGPEFETWMQRASEPEILQYYQILRAQGESRALEWLRGTRAAPPTP